MKILIAPDKFKGSLSAMEVCQAIKEGLQQGRKQYDIHLHPMADGGDGSLEVIGRHLDLEQQFIDTTDPLGRPINTFYYTASNTAFIEMAKASGLVLLQKNERNPLVTSTFGTGQMIADAISKGCESIYLFLGGSATNDGGMGIATALGANFFDHKKNILKPCGKHLSQVDSISVPPDVDIGKLKLTLLCDVNNSLYGSNGAAAVYARQKGADDAMIQVLDNGLKHFSKKLFDYSGMEVATLPGSGAAGGLAAALVSLFDAKVKSGFESFSELTNLEAQVQKADVVISGEGKLDKQSFQGKVVGGLVQLCKKHEKPLVLFVGRNELFEVEQKRLGISRVFSVFDQASGLEDAMGNAAGYLRDLAVLY